MVPAVLQRKLEYLPAGCNAISLASRILELKNVAAQYDLR
jgi:hypothetical protein